MQLAAFLVTRRSKTSKFAMGSRLVEFKIASLYYKSDSQLLFPKRAPTYLPTKLILYGTWFLPRDARSAKRGIAIVSRPSVRLSVRPSVCNVDVPWAYRLDKFEVNYTNN